MWWATMLASALAAPDWHSRAFFLSFFFVALKCRTISAIQTWAMSFLVHIHSLVSIGLVTC